MKDFKAGLEPFGTSGWQAVWKLKHIPPLCKLELAAPMVHMQDHTQLVRFGSHLSRTIIPL